MASTLPTVSSSSEAPQSLGSDQPSSGPQTPLPVSLVEQICAESCTSALQDTHRYDHSQCSTLNTTIIQSVLNRLIEEMGKRGASGYKFAVNSTIVQHILPGTDGHVEGGGRRGMHSATAGYWNVETDGMWNYLFDSGDTKGLSVVVSVLWIAVS